MRGHGEDPQELQELSEKPQEPHKAQLGKAGDTQDRMPVQNMAHIQIKGNLKTTDDQKQLLWKMETHTQTKLTEPALEPNSPSWRWETTELPWMNQWWIQ